MGEPALSVRGLTVGYGDASRPKIVVRDVSFDLTPGEILGLAGESGCGKSTTALTALGYRAPGAFVVAGESRLGGLELLSARRETLRSAWGARVVYLAQNAALALNPALTVGRQLEETLRIHQRVRGGAARARIELLFEQVGLPSSARARSRYPHQFSGGQQQRIAIALAICCGPDVLVLDEPTTGLDVTTQARISRLLRRLVNDTGVAALYVSHDLALLSGFADRLAVMYAGEIVESAPTSLVVGRSLHPYSAALFDSVPGDETGGLPVGIPGRPPNQVVTGRCSFSDRCRHAADTCVAGDIAFTDMGAGHLVRCVRAGVAGQVRVAARPRAARPSVSGQLLELDGVTCRYGQRGSETTAVSAVSFRVGPGETLGVVGESGSGKSTILRAIAGLHSPAEGRVLYRDAELAHHATKRSLAVRREIQLVFQNPDSSLNPRHTVFQLVRRPVKLFRRHVRDSEHREVVTELLDQVRLSADVLERYPRELSGGQKQRVALARAFAAEPLLLLCDEVTSALDVSVQAAVLELIAELAAESGTAVVFVSHDLAVVRAIAGEAIVTHRGVVVEHGATEALFAAPQHPYTRELFAAAPKPPRAGLVAERA